MIYIYIIICDCKFIHMFKSKAKNIITYKQMHVHAALVGKTEPQQTCSVKVFIHPCAVELVVPFKYYIIYTAYITYCNFEQELF